MRIPLSSHRLGLALAVAALWTTGCADGEWQVTTWGEDYIEAGMPAEIFADGCSVVYSTFTVAIAEAALLDGDGEVAGSLEGSRIMDMVAAGPHALGTVTAPATHYDTARFVIGPVADGGGEGSNASEAQVAALGSSSLLVEGTLTCGAESASFSWTFDTETTYLCEPEDLTLPGGGVAETQLTVHGDHLFYDGLENADAAVRGEAILAADADDDGVITQAELSASAVASLGYQVGQYSEVTDLGAFVAFLTQTLGHVDGEGHCQVNL